MINNPSRLLVPVIYKDPLVPFNFPPSLPPSMALGRTCSLISLINYILLVK